VDLWTCHWVSEVDRLETEQNRIDWLNININHDDDYPILIILLGNNSTISYAILLYWLNSFLTWLSSIESMYSTIFLYPYNYLIVIYYLSDRNQLYALTILNSAFIIDWWYSTVYSKLDFYRSNNWLLYEMY